MTGALNSSERLSIFFVPGTVLNTKDTGPNRTCSASKETYSLMYSDSGRLFPVKIVLKKKISLVMLKFLIFHLAVAWKPHMYCKLSSVSDKLKRICKVYP